MVLSEKPFDQNLILFGPCFYCFPRWPFYRLRSEVSIRTGIQPISKYHQLPTRSDTHNICHSPFSKKVVSPFHPGAHTAGIDPLTETLTLTGRGMQEALSKIKVKGNIMRCLRTSIMHQVREAVVDATTGRGVASQIRDKYSKVHFFDRAA